MSARDPERRSVEIDLAQEPAFALGSVQVVPGELAVVGDGRRQELQRRVMQVLVVLAQARPAVVSRDSLIERCWGGRVVGDDAINRCILALRSTSKAFAGPEPFTIETVPRVGHRLVEAARPATFDAPPAVAPRARRRLAWLGVLVAAAVVALGIALWRGSLDRGSAAPRSLAVLPFRSLSTLPADRFFAEGIGDEILDRLTNEPGLRVAARGSTARYRDVADARGIGRDLQVGYVLEGSVRAGAGRVRVTASLVQTRDGMRLWSQTYERGLDDVLEIQRAIGSAVADALAVELRLPPADAAGQRVNGVAYRNYLAARGMLRTRNPLLGGDALALLRAAVKADAGFAPAWAGLAEAIRLEATLKGHDRVIDSLPEAQAAARHALALAPDLAEAHGVLGMLLGYVPSEAQAHLRRAAALDPRSAEAQLRLAAAERVAGRYEAEIAAYRRAFALDPAWFRTSRDLTVAIAEMGDRAGAEALAANAAPATGPLRTMLAARIAWAFGDIAAAAQRWNSVASANSIWQEPARVAFANARFTLRLPGAAPPRAPLPAAELRSNVGRFWFSEAPSRALWLERNRSAEAALVYDEENRVGAKMLLAARRYEDLVAVYDGPSGLLGLRKGTPLTAEDLRVVALVALALRGAGRAPEAQALLAQARSRINAVRAAGAVPLTFDADEAGIAAVADDRPHALEMLERAVRRGWSHSAPDDLLELADEPALGSLRAEPRMIAILASFEARILREHDAALRLGL